MLGGTGSLKVRVEWWSSARHVEGIGEVGVVPTYGREAGYGGTGERASESLCIFCLVPSANEVFIAGFWRCEGGQCRQGEGLIRASKWSALCEKAQNCGRKSEASWFTCTRGQVNRDDDGHE